MLCHPGRDFVTLSVLPCVVWGEALSLCGKRNSASTLFCDLTFVVPDKPLYNAAGLLIALCLLLLAFLGLALLLVFPLVMMFVLVLLFPVFLLFRFACWGCRRPAGGCSLSL